jgi:HSP20 family protein
MQSSVMRPRIHAMAFSTESDEFAEEIRHVFEELGRAFGPESLAGECSPPVDVYETDDTIEVVVDLPGVSADTVRLLCKGNSVLVAGEKAPRRARGESSFHLVERGYGRFARVIRLGRACEMARARATLVNGELRMSFPKANDRRGRTIQIAITSL